MRIAVGDRIIALNGEELKGDDLLEKLKTPGIESDMFDHSFVYFGEIKLKQNAFCLLRVERF